MWWNGTARVSPTWDHWCLTSSRHCLFVQGRLFGFDNFLCVFAFYTCFGFLWFCSFYVFSLGKCKIENQCKGKTCFCCFAYLIFFAFVFSKMQENEMRMQGMKSMFSVLAYIDFFVFLYFSRMQEMECACRKRKCMFSQFFDGFYNFYGFRIRRENAKANYNTKPKENKW